MRKLRPLEPIDDGDANDNFDLEMFASRNGGKLKTQL